MLLGFVFALDTSSQGDCGLDLGPDNFRAVCIFTSLLPLSSLPSQGSVDCVVVMSWVFTFRNHSEIVVSKEQRKNASFPLGVLGAPVHYQNSRVLTI